MKSSVTSLGFLFLICVSQVLAWGNPCPGCTTSDSLLNVASWDMNLTPMYSQHRAERLQSSLTFLSGSTVAGLGLNMMCLQEVFDPADKQALISGLQSSFPYSFSAPQQQQTCMGVCDAQSIQLLSACSSNCVNLEGQNQNVCFQANCNSQLTSSSVQCQSCLFSNAGGNTLTNLLNMCTLNSSVGTDGCKYMFNGYSGNLILSNKPFLATQSFTFNSNQMSASGALWARVLQNGAPVNFFCTDLSPDAFGTNASNAESINAQQTQQLLQWIRTNVPQNEAVIIAGDFNSGPAIGNNQAVFVNNYNLITSAGFTSTLIAAVPAADVPCTNCASTGNSVTDHIFIGPNNAPCIKNVGTFAGDQMISINGTSIPLSSSSAVFASLCYNQQQVIVAIPPSPAPILATTVLPVIQVSGSTSVSSGGAFSAAIVAAMLAAVMYL